MEKNCCFTDGNDWFRFRTAGIIIEYNKLLMITDDICNYFYTVGGAVHLGEKSEDCVEREVLEETGINYKVDHLAAIVENFFDGHGGKIDGKNCHCLEFYYLMKSSGIKDFNNFSKNQDNNNERLEWIPIEKINEYDIKPSFLKERITEILESRNVLHIVNETDRK